MLWFWKINFLVANPTDFHFERSQLPFVVFMGDHLNFVNMSSFFRAEYSDVGFLVDDLSWLEPETIKIAGIGLYIKWSFPLQIITIEINLIGGSFSERIFELEHFLNLSVQQALEFYIFFQDNLILCLDRDRIPKKSPTLVHKLQVPNKNSWIVHSHNEIKVCLFVRF